MDLEARASPKEILKEMPTDVLIAEFYRAAAEASEKDEAVGRWGTAVQWNDLHASGLIAWITIRLWTHFLAYNPRRASWMEIYEQGKTERNLGLALYCLLTMFCSY